MSNFIDLHIHTRYSDGSDDPAVVVQRAVELGISAIAVTDHDTMAGVAEARQAADEAGLGFLEGVELSARFERREVHVLGLGVSPGCSALADAMERLRVGRQTRAEEMMQRLVALGVSIDPARVRARAAGGAMGRLHVARELQATGVVRTVQRAFDRYIAAGRPAYVPKTTLSCDEATALIHGANGLAFVAHPGIGRTMGTLLPRLLELPFDGIEAYHSKHTPGQVAEFLDLAKDRDLLVSGGSDCHGPVGDPSADLGKVRVPIECFERIVKALAKRQTERAQ